MSTWISLLQLLILAVSAHAQDVPVQCTDCSSCEIPVVICKNVTDVCEISNGVIDCSFRKLNASFSEESSKWPRSDVTTLNLEHNLIGRVVRFPRLNLTTLVLRYNTIVDIDSRAFFNLPNLDTLDLSYNYLARLSPDVFQGDFSPTYYEPLNIASLNLSNNQLVELDQNLFEHLPRLTRLDLSSNNLGRVDNRLTRNTVVAIAGSAPNIQLLDLSDTGLSSLPPTFLKNLADLKELVLKKNLFTTVPVHELSFASSLQILNLNYNPISVISSDERFADMPSLLQLHISHMPDLKRIERQSLQGLTNLRYLSCSNNPNLDFIAEDALSSDKISRLELHDNSLHYLPQRMVKSWSSVRLSLAGNRWSCDCENQWMLTTLVPVMTNYSDPLKCSGPPQMQGMFMASLAERKYTMRCLDKYGNHPEKDGAFVIATFAIVVIALVAVGTVFLFRRGRWRRGQAIDYTAIYQQHVRDSEQY